jgi:hypothetical protein
MKKLLASVLVAFALGAAPARGEDLPPPGIRVETLAIAEGMIGVPGTFQDTLAWLVFINVSGRPATAVVTHYFDDRPHYLYSLQLEPHSRKVVGIHDLPYLKGRHLAFSTKVEVIGEQVAVQLVMRPASRFNDPVVLTPVSVKLFEPQEDPQ